MGTPREYGFNDIVKQSISKAEPLSFMPSSAVTPFSGQFVLRSGLPGQNLHAVQSQQPAALLVSIKSGWRWDALRHPMWVGGCCRTSWDSHKPLPVPLELPFFFSITNGRQAAFILEHIRSWGCCNSRTSSWWLDLKKETKKIVGKGEHKLGLHDFEKEFKSCSNDMKNV